MRSLVRFLIVAGLTIAGLLQTAPTSASAGTPPILVFVREDCKHCRDETLFLEGLSVERGDIEVVLYDLAQESNRELWKNVASKAGISKVTPITLIGRTIVVGFDTAQNTGKRLIRLADEAAKDPVFFRSFEEYLSSDDPATVDGAGNPACSEELGAECETIPFVVRIPLLGEVDVSAYPLAVMALVLGFVDGFNPCAMWVLVTFLVLLLQAGTRSRMFRMAGLFIIAEAVMYYLILSVWMTAWDFVGLDRVVTPLVGLLAIGGGSFFLWEYWKKRGECAVGDVRYKAKTRERLASLIHSPLTIMTALGIIGVAFSVNVIEFACSIGIPQAFTKIIDLNNLSGLAQQGLMALYILMYMIDDLIVFGIALWSFEKIGITTRYARISNLIGGLLMLAIGLILILEPELLMFA